MKKNFWILFRPFGTIGIFSLLLVMLGTACASDPVRSFSVLNSYDEVDWNRIEWKNQKLACHKLSDYDVVEYENFLIHVPDPESHLIMPVKSNIPVSASWETDLKLGYQQQFKGIVRREKVPVEVIDVVRLQAYLTHAMPSDSVLKQTMWNGSPAVYFESENTVQDIFMEYRSGYAVVDPVEAGYVYLCYYWIREYKNLKGNVALKPTGEEFLKLVELKRQ